jgi:hypothetical protein
MLVTKDPFYQNWKLQDDVEALPGRQSILMWHIVDKRQIFLHYLIPRKQIKDD